MKASCESALVSRCPFSALRLRTLIWCRRTRFSTSSYRSISLRHEPNLSARSGPACARVTAGLRAGAQPGGVHLGVTGNTTNYPTSVHPAQPSGLPRAAKHGSAPTPGERPYKMQGSREKREDFPCKNEADCRRENHCDFTPSGQTIPTAYPSWRFSQSHAVLCRSLGPVELTFAVFAIRIRVLLSGQR